MSFSNHFIVTDDLIRHLDQVLGSLNDPFIESRYTGFLAISSVTVLELAMKTIFIDFAAAKNKVFGDFCFGYFDRISGRIALDAIRGDYLKKFGPKYLERFKKRLDVLEQQSLQTRNISIKASYANLITWRNDFAHEGRIPANASYADVKSAYSCGKELMLCLSSCMHR